MNDALILAAGLLSGLLGLVPSAQASYSALGQLRPSLVCNQPNHPDTGYSITILSGGITVRHRAVIEEIGFADSRIIAEYIVTLDTVGGSPKKYRDLVTGGADFSLTLLDNPNSTDGTTEAELQAQTDIGPISEKLTCHPVFSGTSQCLP